MITDNPARQLAAAQLRLKQASRLQTADARAAEVRAAQAAIRAAQLEVNASLRDRIAQQ